MELLLDFFSNTGFYLADGRYLVMIVVGILFCHRQEVRTAAALTHRFRHRRWQHSVF